MANDFFLTAGDLLPLMDHVLLNGDGTTRDLTGCTVNLRFRMFDDDPLAAVEKPASIFGDPANGHARYTWEAGDTDRAGVMLAEWVVYFPLALPETFPDGQSDDFPSGYIRVKIKPRL